jgi:hypothetical protein
MQRIAGSTCRRRPFSVALGRAARISSRVILNAALGIDFLRAPSPPTTSSSSSLSRAHLLPNLTSFHPPNHPPRSMSPGWLRYTQLRTTCGGVRTQCCGFVPANGLLGTRGVVRAARPSVVVCVTTLLVKTHTRTGIETLLNRNLFTTGPPKTPGSSYHSYTNFAVNLDVVTLKRQGLLLAQRLSIVYCQGCLTRVVRHVPRPLPHRVVARSCPLGRQVR